MSGKSKACEALRAAGYLALPRWWVTQDQFDVIERMAKGNRDEVYRIKYEATGRHFIDPRD